MSRRHDVRRAKRHLCYTISEIRETFRVSAGTVSAWIKAGLTPIDWHRPYLFSGGELRRFLTARNKPRQPSGAGEIFCVACKRTISPRGGVAILRPTSDTTGNLIGSCPSCGRDCYRRVRLSEAPAKAGALTIRYEDMSVTFSQNSAPPHTGVSLEVAQ